MLKNELSTEQRSTIAVAINRKLPAEIQILQDTEHGSWVCIHYIPHQTKSLRQIWIYHPHDDKFVVENFHENDKQLIDGWYGMSNRSARNALKFGEYQQTNSKQEEFISVLAHALYLHMGKQVSNLKLDLRNGTEYIRKAIVEWLLNDISPLDNTTVLLLPMPVNQNEHQNVECVYFVFTRMNNDF